MFRNLSIPFAICIALFACSETLEERIAPAQPQYDLLIRNGTLYDGSGGEPFVSDIAVVADRIAAIGQGDIQ
jgi:N-acyl-D-amino-acid deacylase